MGTRLNVSAIVIATATLIGAPRAAHACGGFFCNNQQIDQSGERILFSYNADGTVTTIVQILYTGPSEQFAWILPIPAEPTVGIGTDELFRQLERSTAPRFDVDYVTTGACREQPYCSGYYDEDTDYAGGAQDAAVFADAGAAVPPGVDVRLRALVGPYDVAVLAAGDATALRAWLADNGYLIPESAGVELDHYVALNHFFVALKLQQDRGAGEIQPIVLRSANDEPCIPVRLTRIATVPNMPITAYFLGDRRARPLNYMLLVPDLDDSGLWFGTTSYASRVTQTIDDAGGHAFVTDYAGAVPSVSLELPAIEDLRTIADPAAFLMRLQERGFTGDSQLLALLMRFIPPPATWDPQTFYNCIVGGWCDPEATAYLNALAFQPSEFVDALNATIVEPRREAQELLGAHAHLTRLFTTLSAEEMTEDPMFMRSDELPPEFSNVHRGTLRTECGPEFFYWTAPQTFVLPSGREELTREGVAYYGSDTQYCEDYYGGDFHPGTPMDRLREVARSRSVTPGGGGLCTVSRRADAGAVIVLALAGLALALRRRRAARAGAQR